jgi:hypothetical protein
MIDFVATSISAKLESHAADDFGDVLMRLTDPKIGLGEQVVLQNLANGKAGVM